MKNYTYELMQELRMKKNRVAFLLIAMLYCISSFSNPVHITVTGRVSCQNNPLSNVPVTDGVAIVYTDDKGEYILPTTSSSKYIYYTLPTGYQSPIVDGVPLFYNQIKSTEVQQQIDFELLPSSQSQEKHAFIVWADPQVLFKKEFELLDKVVTDVKQTIANLDVPVHGISVGDNVFDVLDFFPLYKKSIAPLNIPFYQVLGNHDMNYNKYSNDKSDSSYTEAFGPSYYSFNVGKIHYVTLKNVFYIGKSYNYMGYIDGPQLDWLKKDLSTLKAGSTVIVSLHIPTTYGDSETETTANAWVNSVLNKEAL
ncbi:MAG: metallophosphoesterase N-terminal domain-containing protein, partial [Bacteroidales bacterium]